MIQSTCYIGSCSKAPLETRQCGKLRRRWLASPRLAPRHAALLCTVLPCITSTIDPNALDAEPIKRPLVRLRHPTSDTRRPRAFYCGPSNISSSTRAETHLRSLITMADKTQTRPFFQRFHSNPLKVSLTLVSKRDLDLDDATKKLFPA